MKTTITILSLVLLLAACTTAPIQTSTESTGEAQIVNVGVSKASYTFDKETLKAGKPVRLVFDVDQLQGCSRSVTIPSYGINKLISHEDNTIEFTPKTSGPVKVSCSMAMYTGEIMVS